LDLCNVVFSIDDSEAIYGIPASLKLAGLSQTPFRLKESRHGRVMYSTNDIYIGWSMDLYGEWCEGELDVVQQVCDTAHCLSAWFQYFLGQVVQPGDVAVDIGAHIGTFTLGLAEFVGPTGRVLAFEPQRILYQILSANAAFNSYSWVRRQTWISVRAI
jgi:hypothetical protein